ncbi:beta-ketoacyl synthase chain length factor [Ideonella sp.]|uniref:beta-ketoacyl synthase chain length factor n=1 Tax=Ideonella sp. TaxID=1929293 RepID=UPI0035B3BC55
MNVEFVIRDWTAWAPGLERREQWGAWAGQPARVPDAVPSIAAPVAGMPPMVRRRLNPLGRMAADVAYQLLGPQSASPPGACPVVFASRYGDAERALALLAEAARGEPLSPTAFGLSVHNAIGATCSIARGDRDNHTALAAGPATAALGLLEAAALLADGAPEAAVVCYDAPLPGEYAAFMDEPVAAHAWGCRIALPGSADAPRIRLGLASPPPGAAAQASPDDALPFSLSLLRFLIGQAPAWQRRAEPGAAACWQGSRHG